MQGIVNNNNIVAYTLIACDRISGSKGSVADIVTAPGNGLQMFFVTDGSVSNTGFMARFRRFNGKRFFPNELQENRLCFSVSADTCTCGKLVYEVTSSGEISSPNYPDPYCHNIHCYHILRTDRYHSVELTIDRMELEQGRDLLILNEGESNYTSLRNNRIAT